MSQPGRDARGKTFFLCAFARDQSLKQEMLSQSRKAAKGESDGSEKNSLILVTLTNGRGEESVTWRRKRDVIFAHLLTSYARSA